MFSERVHTSHMPAVAPRVVFTTPVYQRAISQKGSCKPQYGALAKGVGPLSGSDPQSPVTGSRLPGGSPLHVHSAWGSQERKKLNIYHLKVRLAPAERRGRVCERISQVCPSSVEGRTGIELARPYDLVPKR